MCLPVRPYGTTRIPLGYVRETWYFSIFRKPNEKIQVSVNSDKNIGYFKGRAMYICDNISFILRMGNVSDKTVEKMKSHVLCSRTFFFENNNVYKLMGKN